MSALAIEQGTPEWLEARTTCVTATDIAAILGLHPYKTPAQVYLDKTGQGRQFEPNEAMQTGTHLEPSIAQWFAFKHGLVPQRAEFVRHPKEPIFGASPDYLVGDDRVLECKWCGLNAAQGFGEGPDDVPTHYLLQVQWQCFVSGRDKWHLVVLGPWGFREYCGLADPELHTRMAFHARKFWHEYVQAECPPPLTGQPADTQWVKEKHPESSGETIAASYEIEETITKMRELHAQKTEVETEYEACANQVKDFMGAADTLTSFAGPFRWSNTKGRTETDWGSVIGELASTYQVPEADLSAAIERHTKPKPGFRRFTTPFKSDRA